MAFQGAHTVTVPMKDTTFFPNEVFCSPEEKTKYAAKIGSSMYAMVETRIDIALATSMVSRFSNNPGKQHFAAVDIYFYDT